MTGTPDAKAIAESRPTAEAGSSIVSTVLLAQSLVAQRSTPSESDALSKYDTYGRPSGGTAIDESPAVAVVPPEVVPVAEQVGSAQRVSRRAAPGLLTSGMPSTPIVRPGWARPALPIET